MSGAADRLRALGDALGGPVVLDDWRPAVQGVVGHVVGVRGPDGTPYAAKLFAADRADRAATEAAGLRLARDVGAPVPDVVASVPDGAGGAVLLLSRLPGARWGDRLPALGPVDRHRLHGDVAALLRRLHGRRGERFGPLLPGGETFADAWSAVTTRAERTMEAYVAAGGPVSLAARVRTVVASRGSAFAAVRPVLCHHDLNGGNVLVAATGAPRITGLTDFEKASWDDPMADLALTVLHVRGYDEPLASVLVEAYGPSDADRVRLEVHVLLLAVAARTWIVHDRPAGWAASVARLDALVAAS